MSFWTRLQHGWNAFRNKDPADFVHDIGPSYHYRPDQFRYNRGNEKSIVTSVFNKISTDVASIDIMHIRLDKEGRYLEPVESGLNNCLTLEANIDQTAHAFKIDTIMSMFDEGVIAIAMERKGYVSDRCEINRQIRKDNSFLRNIMDTIKYLFKTIFAIVDRIADEMEEVRVNMLALEYDRFKGYPDETAIQKQMQTYRALQVKAADLDQEKLNEKRMSIRPQKEEEAQKRISDLYGYCQDTFFRASKNAIAKRLGEQPTDIEKQEPNKQTVPTPSWLKGRKKKDDRDER